jgi:hypothetical protein
MTALVALMLADRGELDLNAPVTKYWPEFARHGKSAIAARMFLGHTAGMPGWTETVTFEDILDWEKATTLLARQAPWLRPGTVSVSPDHVRASHWRGGSPHHWQDAQGVLRRGSRGPSRGRLPHRRASRG